MLVCGHCRSQAETAAEVDFGRASRTNFSMSRDVGILDSYTVLIAVAAFLALAEHGALWIALKTQGELEQRARRAAARLWWGALAAVSGHHICQFQRATSLEEKFPLAAMGIRLPADSRCRAQQ
jgi:cytochrome bd-type quinol oxidase subunit 2